MKLKYRYWGWKYKVRKAWHKAMHGIDVCAFNGTMLPQFGKGKFVSVHRKGPFIDIVCHERSNKSLVPAGTIRLIPYQPNHGVMVEYINPVTDHVETRYHLDYDALYRHCHGCQESTAQPKV